jgi:hypothetical protein
MNKTIPEYDETLILYENSELKFNFYESENNFSIIKNYKNYQKI